MIRYCWNNPAVSFCRDDELLKVGDNFIRWDEVGETFLMIHAERRPGKTYITFLGCLVLFIFLWRKTRKAPPWKIASCLKTLRNEAPILKWSSEGLISCVSKAGLGWRKIETSGKVGHVYFIYEVDIKTVPSINQNYKEITKVISSSNLKDLIKQIDSILLLDSLGV